jgi:hypothetical protein
MLRIFTAMPAAEASVDLHLSEKELGYFVARFLGAAPEFCC